jgi:hypothetical protein
VKRDHRTELPVEHELDRAPPNRVASADRSSSAPPRLQVADNTLRALPGWR